MAFYYKMRQILLQNAAAILLQNATKVYYKVRQDFYYKSDSFITKCDSYYKMRRLIQIATVHRIIQMFMLKYVTILQFTRSD